MSVPMEPTALWPHLSDDRMRPYLLQAKGSPRVALELYEWNVRLSGAFYQALHLVEVVLRNALDRRLREWNARQTRRTGDGCHATEWLLDPAHLLQRLVPPSKWKDARAQAVRAVRQRRQVGHGDMLAQFSFGTWRYLLPDKDAGRRHLWNDALRQAFPYYASVGEADLGRLLVDHVDDLYRLRNRVAHLEPLLLGSSVYRVRLRQMSVVLAWIDPETSRWLDQFEQVTELLHLRPVV